MFNCDEFFDILSKRLSKYGAMSIDEIYVLFKKFGITPNEVKHHLKNLSMMSKIKVENWRVELLQPLDDKEHTDLVYKPSELSKFIR